MGCTSISHYSIKNPQIAGFFQHCQQYGFAQSKVVKVTEYEFQYRRGSKSWVSEQSKSIFNSSFPVLLSPCLPDAFDKLIKGLSNFKQLYPEEFKDFPQNLGLLLRVGDEFPSFQAEILGSNQVSTFEISKNLPTLFVFWKLEEQKTIQKVSLHQTRSVINRFKEEDNTQLYLETAFQRAKRTVKRPFNLVGICMDTPERKSLYEQFLLDDVHIWINETDQSAQVFRFAESNNLQIRNLEQSIYIISQKGIFMGCVKENFGDQNFVHEINDIIDEQATLTYQQSQQIRQQNFEQQIENGIRRDDYQKVKKLIVQELPEKDKKPVGDTFRLYLKKHTFYYDYQKIGATYFKPVFQAAGSSKYKANCDELIQFVKDYTPIAHMDTDFKEHHSLNKKVFFEKLSSKIKSIGFEDVKFILEKQLELTYDQGFKMNREITSIHNAPLSVSCVYSRKEQLIQLSKNIFAVSEIYSHKEMELLKGFFSNPYGVNTSFNIGTIYSPIPNTYKVQHNDQSIIQSTIKPQSKGIFDSKLVQSVNQSIDDPSQQFAYLEKIKSDQSHMELSAAWDGDNQVDLNYDQVDTIHQVNNEVLIIYLIDYTQAQQLELLQQLLDFIKRNSWTKDDVRVIGLGNTSLNEIFEKNMNRLESEMRKGIFEPWFPLTNSFLGVNFTKLLSDLYGLDPTSPILVIDHLKRLLYKGMPDQKFAPLLTKIINQQSLKTVHAVDRPLKHRIDLAEFRREWRIIKQYGMESIDFSPAVQLVLKFIEKMPLKSNEFWKLKMQQFQLWNENGQFIRKCCEKPQIIYKFDRPELSVKFYNIVEEIQRLVGKDKIEVIDLNSEQIKDKNPLIGESLIR